MHIRHATKQLIMSIKYARRYKKPAGQAAALSTTSAYEKQRYTTILKVAVPQSSQPISRNVRREPLRDYHSPKQVYRSEKSSESHHCSMISCQKSYLTRSSPVPDDDMHSLMNKSYAHAYSDEYLRRKNRWLR